PNPVERTSFAQQRQAMEQGFRGQQPAAGGDGSRSGGQAPGGFRGQLRNDAANRRPADGPAARELRPPAQNPANGWRRFGDPGQNGSPSRMPSRQRQEGGVGPGQVRMEAPERSPAQANPQPNRGNWQRFGEPGGSRQTMNQPGRSFQDR